MYRLPFFTSLLLLYACGPAQQKPVPPEPPEPAISIIPIWGDTLPQALHSITDIKDLLLAQLQKHQADDTTYQYYISLEDTVNDLRYEAEIVIGRVFHPSVKSAVLGWSVTDTSRNIAVFDLHDDGRYTSIFTANDQPSPHTDQNALEAFLFFEDYNGDGWKDLRVVEDDVQMMAHVQFSQLWLVKDARFTPVRFFEDIESPEPEEEAGVIVSYHSIGCADMNMHFALWKLKGDAVFQTADIYMDCCEHLGDKCEVRLDDKKPIVVPRNKVHLYAPKAYREAVKEKVAAN